MHLTNSLERLNFHPRLLFRSLTDTGEIVILQLEYSHSTPPRIFEEFTDYCKDTSKDTQFEIKTGKSAAERTSTMAEHFLAVVATTSCTDSPYESGIGLQSVFTFLRLFR